MNWYCPVQRMDKERLPKIFLEWRSHERRRKGRPRHSRMQKITTGMRENGMDRPRIMEKKNKTLGTGRSKNIDTLYTQHIHTYIYNYMKCIYKVYI